MKGDGKWDDTSRVWRFINQHRVLFIRGGLYRVTGPLELKPDTVLIGLNPGNTSISLAGGTPVFAGAGEPIGVLTAPKGGKTL